MVNTGYVLITFTRGRQEPPREIALNVGIPRAHMLVDGNSPHTTAEIMDEAKYLDHLERYITLQFPKAPGDRYKKRIQITDITYITEDEYNGKNGTEFSVK